MADRQATGTRGMRFGLPGGRGVNSPEGPGTMLEIVREADALGYDHLWFAEGYLRGQAPTARGTTSPIVQATAAAVVTTRIRLGLSVLLPGLHNPARLAGDIASLDKVSGGRVIVGAGWPRDWYARVIGGATAGDGEAGAKHETGTIEAVEGPLDAMIRYWRGDPVGTDGGEYQLQPLPVQRPHPPVHIAPHTDEAIGWAARRGYGIVLPALQELGAVKESVTRFRDAGGSAEQVYLERFALVAETDDEAGQTARQAAVELTGRFREYGVSENANRFVADPELDPEHFYREIMVAGGPDTVRARLEQLNDSTGIKNILLRPSNSGSVPLAVQQRTVKLFASDAMPHLR